MRKSAKTAFVWIINILKKLNIPFQITGGLAAIAYGVKRPLEDIDIDISEEHFSLVKTQVKNFIVNYPERFKDESWDLLLMTLNYHGQLIDISGAFCCKIYNKKTHQWQHFPTDFSKITIKKIFDVEVPVIAQEELLYYKNIIARPVDLIDIQQIRGIKTLKEEKRS